MTANCSDPSSRTRTVLLIGLVWGISLLVRLIYFHQVRGNPLYQFITLDERGNHDFALAILHHTVPPISYYKAPLYPYFLAGVYALLGPESIDARLIQCLVVSVNPVLTLLIARWLFGWVVGVVAGLWAAVFWTFVYYSTELLDAATACTWYLLLAYFLVAWDDRRWSKWLVCGIVLGLGAITRPNILPFAPVLAVIVLIVTLRKTHGDASSSTSHIPADNGENRAPEIPTPEYPGRGRRALVRVTALTIGCCAAVLPVTLRNRIVGGEWVLIGAYGGLNIHVANNPHSDSKNGPLLVDESRFLPNTTWDPNEPWARCCLNYKNAYRLTEGHLGRRPTPGEFSSHLSRLGMEYIRENPGWFARHALRRFCWLFNAYEFPSNKDIYHFARFSGLLRVLSYFHYGWMAPLALVGLGIALMTPSLRTARLAYIVAMWGSLALPALMFIINARFRVPMVNLMVPFAAFALVTIVRMARQPTGRLKLIPLGIALVVLGLFCNLNVFGYRQDHQPYLRFAYAVACTMSGRDDLLDGAIADFERDLAIDMENYRRTGQRSNTTLLMDHCTPMRLLFPYHVRKGQPGKAINDARQMLEHEGVDGPWALRLFDFLVETDQRDLADRALKEVVRHTESTHPAIAAAALLRYGRRWNDRSSLERAGRLFDGLVSVDPGNLDLGRGLEETKRLLAAQTTTFRSSAPSRQP